jgi:cyclopropane-fatty-acyl-phospholipid synthase
MNLTAAIAERGLLPDFVIRWGIRRLHRKTLSEVRRGDAGAESDALQRLIRELRESPIAIDHQRANEQHYEVPSAFFRLFLGPHLKYSSGLWKPGTATLREAEEAMLALTCNRAGIENGMEILELGCGWGSLSLWMAQHYPRSRILAVSNSSGQRELIQGRCAELGMTNLEVLTADMNAFDTDRGFDRIVSVEMFEHMRNWEELLARISRWLKPEGHLFVHHFSHREVAYLFRNESDDDWMGYHFFAGGMMPSDGLIQRFQQDLIVEDHWRVNGRHYQHTLEAWLARLDSGRSTALPILAAVYGPSKATVWFNRWRLFLLACSELFGYHDGNEWFVSHYRLKRRTSQSPTTAMLPLQQECMADAG